jgi:hypothetical protein
MKVDNRSLLLVSLVLIVTLCSAMLIMVKLKESFDQWVFMRALHRGGVAGGFAMGSYRLQSALNADAGDSPVAPVASASNNCPPV